MTRITKNELVAINAKLAAEVAALRAELSALKVTKQAGQRPTKSHEYATYEEAVAACKRLAASDANKKASFSVTGTTVIARARWH